MAFISLNSPLKGLLAALFFILMAIPACLPSAEPDYTTSPDLPADDSKDTFTEARGRMVEEQIRRRGVDDQRVLSAMAKVPRHRFVPSDQITQAYADHPLPIGYAQTISQPYVVALMTQHLSLPRGEKVLEIGTGSGYQAAILAELTEFVYSVEIIEPLAHQAEETLKSLGYNIKCRAGDGYYGWEEQAPFDAIIVTCAPDHIPQPLLRQLKDGGRLVIPVGPPGFYQTLWLVERKGEHFQSTNLGDVAFVPMLGQH